MTKFVLTAEDSGYKITHEFVEVFLDDLVSNMNLFLKGAGFVYDGKLEIVNPKQEDSPFEFVVEDYMNMMDTYEDPMNIDLSDITIEFPEETCGAGGGSTCGNCGCGKSNAN